MTVIFDSSWPVISVNNGAEMLMVSDDLWAFEDGVITADEFIELWGIHPARNWQIVMEV